MNTIIILCRERRQRAEKRELIENIKAATGICLADIPLLHVNGVDIFGLEKP
ncbi:hypothetical protein LCGC14_1303860 [marine sediment metagenome]|uniref:Uncharacterized protein n=1 Tax=marine sediment metagenome TaxID=412755 RepID=A0A0F9NRT9_9ZZZZ